MSLSETNGSNTEKEVEADIRKNFDGNDGSMHESDGGWDGWMSVVGVYLILFSTMGYVYSFGVYQDFYTRKFLFGLSPSKISWMGAFQLALPFAIGPLAGKLFAAGYARLAIVAGSLLYVFSLFMLSLAREGQFYQVFLSQGLGMGLGVGFIFTPTTALVGVHFKRRRSLALGIAMSGMGFGALAFPILINQLLPKIGFANTVRVSGYAVLGCLVAGNLLIRLPPRVAKKAEPVKVASFFRDAVYLWYLVAAFTGLLSLYFPTFYLQLYAVEHNIDSTLAFYSLAILNGVGTIGRVFGSVLADRYGAWNMIVLASIGSTASVWLILAISNSVSLVIISCIYGIFSGAWLVLGVSTLVSLARTPHEVGVRMGIAYALMSLGALISGPVQGALLSEKYHWIRPVTFSGVLMIVATVSLAIGRMILSKRKNSQRI